MLLAQNLILMGIFFTIPLYLQIVLGLDALETGVRMLPASVGLFIAALVGSALATRFAPRPLVRAGLVIVFVSTLMLLATIEPELDNGSFLVAMGVLGVGMGLIVSQLGNVVQSAVGDDDRSEAGGLQNTAQQLGSSLGTALLGAVVITGLIARLHRQRRRRSAHLRRGPRPGRGEAQRGGQLRLRRRGAGRAPPPRASTPATTDALVDDYEDAQLIALKTAFLFAALLTLASFWSTRRLPTQRFDELQAGPDPPRLDPEPSPA